VQRGEFELCYSEKKQNPAESSRVHAILENVNNKRLRRPNVSMVQTARNAKSQFTRPKPQEAKMPPSSVAEDSVARRTRGMVRAREIVALLEYYHLDNERIV
jgi:hypothetical protein